MKQTIYPFLVIAIVGLFTAIGLPSCRKDKFQPTIKQYDSIQIVNYIAKNGLTGFKRDTTGGDTSGIYYKIINPGSGTPMQYSDKVTLVYTERTFDGLYSITDTIAQHYYDFLGHLYNDGYPLGMQTAVHNLMIYPNAIMRVLIPSHLAYGIAGKGSGSSEVANNRIAGNQCIDMYVHGVNNFPVYDDMVIQNYMRDSALTNYTKVQSTTLPGNYYYYKILKDSITNDPITQYSTITATYTGQLLDAVIFDGSSNGANYATLPIADFATVGNEDALINFARAGVKISIIMPSTLGYGIQASGTIPPFSCLRFTWQILTVTP